MKEDRADAALLNLNSHPSLPAKTFWPGQPLLDQTQFIVESEIQQQWFERAENLLGLAVPTHNFRVVIYDIRSLFVLQSQRSVDQDTARRGRMARRLQQIQNAAAKLLASLSDPPGFVSWEVPIIQRLLAAALADNPDRSFATDRGATELFISQLLALREETAALTVRFQRSGGRPTNDALRILILSLANLYEGMTSTAAGRAVWWENGKPHGRFFEFVAQVYSLLGRPWSEKSAQAIDGHIRRSLLNLGRRRTSHRRSV
jgi:hypothetical protein